MADGPLRPTWLSLAVVFGAIGYGLWLFAWGVAPPAAQTPARFRVIGEEMLTERISVYLVRDLKHPTDCYALFRYGAYSSTTLAKVPCE